MSVSLFAQLGSSQTIRPCLSKHAVEGNGHGEVEGRRRRKLICLGRKRLTKESKTSITDLYRAGTKMLRRPWLPSYGHHKCRRLRDIVPEPSTFPLRVANDARHPGLLRREQQGKTTNPPVALPTALAWTEGIMQHHPAYVNRSYITSHG